MSQLTGSDHEHLEKAGAWLHLGNAIEANNELEEITAKHRANPAVLDIRLGIYQKLERWDGAAEIAKALILAKPDRMKYWIAKAEALTRLGKTNEADETIKRARESRTWGVGDLFDLVVEAQELGLATEALETIKSARNSPFFKELKALALEIKVLQNLHNEIREL